MWKTRMVSVLILFIFLAFVALGGRKEGVYDYRIVEEQFFEEYTERYEYWDILTLNYVRLEGLEKEVQDAVNNAIYEAVFQKANYWHYQPDEEVRQFQKSYTMYADDVVCYPWYHSQYLVSFDFRQYYAPDNPAFYVNFVRWGMTFDLLTGEEYELEDILKTDDDGFIRLWLDRIFEGGSWEEKYFYYAEAWFTRKGVGDGYFIEPYYFVTEEGDMLVGVVWDVVNVHGLTPGEPQTSTLEEVFTLEELEPYQTDSLFWERLQASETAGEVVVNEKARENLWLGEDAAVWEHYYGEE